MKKIERLLFAIEVIAVLVAAVFGVLWLESPSGPYEPVTFVALLIGTTVVELVRRTMPRETQIEVLAVKGEFIPFKDAEKEKRFICVKMKNHGEPIHDPMVFLQSIHLNDPTGVESNLKANGSELPPLPSGASYAMTLSTPFIEVQRNSVNQVSTITNPIHRGQIVEYVLPQSMLQEIHDMYPKIGKLSDFPKDRVWIAINQNTDETLAKIPIEKFRDLLRRLE